jgi:hypothetical protein
MTQKNNTYVKNAQGLVFIYNYRDRLGDSNLQDRGKDDVFEIDQIILNSTSLKSITTQKAKSSPSGSFEIRLAPLKDWVAAITPGSWCVILMTSKNIDDKAKYGGGKVDPSSFKMMGRIEAVRAVVSTDQSSGNRITEYVVTGSDWGTIFNTMLYVDPLIRAGPNVTAVGINARFGYDAYILEAFDTNSKTGSDAKTLISTNDKNISDILTGKKDQSQKFTPKSDASKYKVPTSQFNINFLINLWGRDGAGGSIDNISQQIDSLLIKTNTAFKIPDKLQKYMGFASNDVSNIITQITGILTGLDTYNNKDHCAGVLEMNNILGENTFWSVIVSNSNQTTNEIIPDVRFENDKPILALYNRVKPFVVNSKSNIMNDSFRVGDGKGADKEYEETVGELISPFKNIRRIQINSDDVISCSYATNWRDRVNFVEVGLSNSLYKDKFANALKIKSQFIDELSVARDGLLSLRRTTFYVPLKKESIDPLSVNAYKYLMKEWYFNTHKMLNGSMTLIGQNQYIQVGDNIIVDAKVLGHSMNLNSVQAKTRKNTYILAHVEAISHSVSADSNGIRIFTTSINFVRGIITDINGNTISGGSLVGAVDQDTSLLTPSLERNRNMVPSSGPRDPDRQKLKGY